ncbi:MAG: PP2C family protein-serine/threonine phosphatase [Gemmatimonadaceae bacterium]
MSITSVDSVTSPVRVDAFGITHQGNVRATNEDHFVIAQLSKSVVIQHTSVSRATVARRFGVANAYLFAVADGVGGRSGGDVASGKTVATVLDYFGGTAECFHGLDVTREHEVLEKLEHAVRSVHDALLQEFGGERAEVPATTLTMMLLVWPRAYLIHVGDSRAYVRRRGRLQCLTRDQTFGQYMVDVGAWTAEQAARPGPAATLASAVGGTELTPVVGLVDLDVGDSIVLCTDGLTKHVSDERIGEVVATSPDAHSASQQLIDEALAAGGSDNVTVVVVRSEEN